MGHPRRERKIRTGLTNPRGTLPRCGWLGGLCWRCVTIWIYEAVVWVEGQHLLPAWAGIPAQRHGAVFGSDVHGVRSVGLGFRCRTFIHFFFAVGSGGD